METPERYLGKYRGVVVNNQDPEGRGRIQAIVPDVLGPFTPSSWALPCLPVAGLLSGAFMVPDFRSHVWMEFEQGDPNFPIWTGCFWASRAETPDGAEVAKVPPVSNIAFKTLGQNSLIIAGTPDGGIVLKAGIGPGQSALTLKPGRIELAVTGGGSVVIEGLKVSINKNALEII